MTQKDPSDFDPKHRIIGAVIIVSLAVIFVPMILDRPSTPPDTSSVSQIPVPASDAENKVVVTPVPPPAPKQSTPEKPIVDAEPPKPAVIAEAPKAAPKPSAPAADKPAPTKPVAKAASSAPTKPAPKPEPKAAEIKSGWVVQVGTFSNAGNAVRLETQLKKHGHAVSRERIARDGGSALRLRVGPFRDKALAQKAQGQIEKETGVKGVVLAYP
ncbi:MAG: SPOR domain-containing protein [Gammaproteobacteria bacterium]